MVTYGGVHYIHVAVRKVKKQLQNKKNYLFDLPPKKFHYMDKSCLLIWQTKSPM